MSWRSLFWLLPPALLGTLLRLWNLPAQIVGGDEIHAIRAALELPLGEVLTTYQLQDPSLPIAGFYRFLLDLGVPLSEFWVHLPVLAFGLIALVAIPWIAERRVGRPAAQALAWLVALAPLLVLYSRIGRPYMPIALLGFAATAAFESWWRTGRRSRAIAYVVLAGLCVYFHLGSAPFIVAPFAFALGSLLLDRHRVPEGDQQALPGFRDLVIVGLATVVAFLTFLIPSWDSLMLLIGNKHNPMEIVPETVFGILQLQSGSMVVPMILSFWAAALVGLAWLLRNDRRLALYTLTLTAGQVVGLLVLSPEMLVHPLVFSRYLIPLLPWVLLWAAVGVSMPWRVGPRMQRVVVAAGLAALFATGPLSTWQFQKGSFSKHNDVLAFFCPPGRTGPASVPGFYRQVVAGQQGATVLEHPWFPWWAYTRAYYLYQEVHGQEVVLSSIRPLPGAAQVQFRNMVRPYPADFLASRARYLVVHTDLPTEEARVVPHCWPTIASINPEHMEELRQAGQRMARRLTRTWGEPDFSERGILVWDLERIRSRKP